MASKIVICVLLLAVLGCTLAKIHHKGKGKGSYTKSKKGYKSKPTKPSRPEVLPPLRPCDGVQCGVARECIVTEEQEPSCQCVQSCEPIDHEICGSDGVTYPNKCELHRAACVQETKITQVKVGPCEVAPIVAQTRAPPVVCYQADRNVLQQKLVQWLQSNEMADGWFLRGKAYTDVIDEYFKMFDESRDEVLDTTEFRRFVEHNETVRNSTSTDENTEEDNQLLRSMCVDALLAEADLDFDWRLNLKEFEACLRQDFEPGTKMCSLEGNEYADGDEMQNRCNECVCACGNWVCTANACDGDMVAGTETQEEYNPAEENAMNEKEWKAIMKKLAKINPEQFPSHVRDLKHLTDNINAPRAPEPAIDEIIGEEEFEDLELGEEEFEELELAAEEVGQGIEEEEEEVTHVPAKVVDQMVPIVPAMIDEGAVPALQPIPVRPQGVAGRVSGKTRVSGKRRVSSKRRVSGKRRVSAKTRKDGRSGQKVKY